MSETINDAIIDAVDALAPTLLEVSHAIHANPELAFEEHFAADLLTRTVEQRGIDVQRGAYGLQTAFEAAFGSGGPTIAILAEYDALPGIGHACGHNIIATSALGAALALNEIGVDAPGRVRLLGTPAEERGGGKELMAREGAFEQVDAAIMIHPAGVNLASMPCICVAEVEVIYHGLSAHASAMPHMGKNALDGLLLAYQGISNLRQHIQSTERIHGIVTDGGQAPNIVPERAKGEFYVRAKNAKDLAELKPRVAACFEAGATASGTRVEINWSGVDYLDLNTNWPLANRFQAHAETLGRRFIPYEKVERSAAGSTDMGNVSYRVPSIHPMLAAAPQDVVIHNPRFTEFSASPMGDAAVLDGAKSLALTALDYLMDTALREDAHRAFGVAEGLV